MGPFRTIVDTAWADVQSRFGALCTAQSVVEPSYVFGESDWMSRTKYPVIFCTVDYVRQETSAVGDEQVLVALDLVIAHTSSRPDTLETNMLDYTDCMLQLVRDDHTFNGACHVGEFVSSDLYSGSQNDRDMAVAIVSFLLRKELLS